jgi:hypothetical protein
MGQIDPNLLLHSTGVPDRLAMTQFKYLLLLLLLLLEHYSPLWTLASITILTQLYRLLNKFGFTGLGCHPMTNPQPGGPGCLS